jgi:ABC-type multidrug transport system fused ATPase/permease subunit
VDGKVPQTINPPLVKVRALRAPDAGLRDPVLPVQAEPLKIDVEHLSFFYGEKRALEDISIKIQPHVVTAFIGPSGCGKSTFLRTLNRMNDIIPGARVEGRVCIDGQDIYRPVWTSLPFAARSAWCSRNQIRFQSRSSKTSPMDCASTD